jgi:hypothetical protein
MTAVHLSDFDAQGDRLPPLRASGDRVVGGEFHGPAKFGDTSLSVKGEDSVNYEP